MGPCQRAGCPGRYADDGYCDTCGHRAPARIATLAPTDLPDTAAMVPGRSGAPPRPRADADALPATVASGPVSGRTPSGRTGSARSRTIGRGGLGANLVEIAPIPRRDPATAVLADPQVPERQRFCVTCGKPVGRGRDGQPGLVEGFCPRDRTRFSFRPRLSPGDVVDNRYEILGALAHGGLGWIYLARDRNVSDAGADRWVVLKGLINLADRDALSAAMAERRFLVEVDHPNIVKIHDFAQHADPQTGDMASYIVMEYVGGTSLKERALTHVGPTGRRAPLPLPEVLAYGLEVLPALGYLHDRGLLFCDFKPDNVIHTEEQLKLIDLGAVIRMGDDTAALFGTPGYQAPELARHGPSVSSDLYTVGRTLAVLSFDFKGFSTTYVDRLPDDVPLLNQHESYHRLLLRATHADPAQRFHSADELGGQMLGVLREVLSAADGVARPAVSRLFGVERFPFGTGADVSTSPDGHATAAVPGKSGGSGADGLSPREVAAALPLPLVDLTDPGAAVIATLGADPDAAIETLRQTGEPTIEIGLRLVRAHLDAGRPMDATAALNAVDVDDWRADWYAGLIGLAAELVDDARAAFDRVYSALPGEAAALLALAAADELAGDRDRAAGRYDRVWRVDRGFLSAAFGLARVRLAGGDRSGAVTVLDQVPDSSSQHLVAQVAAVRARLDHGRGGLAAADLADASARLARLRLDSARQAALAIEIFRTALDWLSSQPKASHTTVLGQELTEESIRRGLEQAYRTLAALQTDKYARYQLVDRANAVRPRTLT
jgi:serine/threonine-protein kinase PknG